MLGAPRLGFIPWAYTRTSKRDHEPRAGVEQVLNFDRMGTDKRADDEPQHVVEGVSDR